MPIVDVPGKGEVEFPDSMSFDDMDKAIRSTWPELVPKAAAPTADAAPAEEPFSVESDYTPPNLQSLKEFFTAHPNIPKPVRVPDAPKDAGMLEKAATTTAQVVSGLTTSAIGAVEGAATPLTAGIISASAIPVVGPAIATTAGLGFGAHMIISGIQDFSKAYQAGDIQGAAEALGNTVMGAFIGGASGKHGIKQIKTAREGVPIEPVKDAALKQQAAEQALSATLPATITTGEVPPAAKVLAPVATEAFEKATGATETFAETPPPLPVEPVRPELVNPNKRVSLNVKDESGNNLEIKMKADEAYRRLSRRENAFKSLLDCLGR